MRTMIILMGVLPLALNALAIFWLYATKPKSRLYSFTVFAFVSVFLTATLFAYGYWYFVGMYWPFVLAAGFAAVVLARVLRHRPIPKGWLPARWSGEFFLIPLVLMLTLTAGVALPYIASSKSTESAPLKLAAPLTGGAFVVLAGGANWSVNQHQYSGPEGVLYAIDIGRLNAIGMRASGLSPTSLESYEVFGNEVIAPCAGEVVDARDGRPDQPPANPNFDDAYGNFVVLFCDGHSVMLAHLQENSVSVRVGDRVDSGARLGLVGNSGGALEPHLHLHAVRGRHSPDNDLMDVGLGVPMRLNGRFLIKHEWFNN